MVDLTKVFEDASVDAESLEKFTNATSDVMVSRRLSPPIKPISYYVEYMDSLSSGKDAAIKSLAVSTGQAGTEASVVTGGTFDARTFHLTIPRGDKGERGIDSENAAVVVKAAIEGVAIDANLITDALIPVVPKTGGVARTQFSVNADTINVMDFINNRDNDCTGGFNKALDYLESRGGGTLHVPAGTYKIQPSSDGIKLRNNTAILAESGTRLENLPHDNTHYSFISLNRVTNSAVSNLVLDGRRDLRYLKNQPTKYYRDVNALTSVAVGDIVYAHSVGFEVMTAGNAPRISFGSYTNVAVGNTVVASGITLKVVEQGLGEWGHGLSVSSSTKVYVDNVQSSNMWGDGAVFGGGKVWDVGKSYEVAGIPFSEHVYINHLSIDNCRRQGISILSLKNSVLNDVTIRNIGGTGPEAGIDFEPERPDECLSNVVFNRLDISNTRSACFMMWLTTFSEFNRTATDADITKFDISGFYPAEVGERVLEMYRNAYKDINRIKVEFNDCIFNSIGSSSSIYASSKGGTNPDIKGEVKFKDCTFIHGADNNANALFKLSSISADGFQHVLVDCSFEYRGLDGGMPIQVNAPTEANKAIGGLHIKRCAAVRAGGTVKSSYFALLYLRSFDYFTSYDDVLFKNVVVEDCSYLGPGHDNFAIFLRGKTDNVHLIDPKNKFSTMLYPVSDNIKANKIASSYVLSYGSGAGGMQDYATRILDNLKTFKGHKLSFYLKNVPPAKKFTLYYRVQLDNCIITGLGGNPLNTVGSALVFLLYNTDRLDLILREPNHGNALPPVWEFDYISNSALARSAIYSQELTVNKSLLAGETLKTPYPNNLVAAAYNYTYETNINSKGLFIYCNNTTKELEITNMTAATVVVDLIITLVPNFIGL